MTARGILMPPMSTPKPRGRPPIARGEPSAAVHLTLSISVYDRLYHEASAARVTVPERVRQALVRDLELVFVAEPRE